MLPIFHSNTAASIGFSALGSWLLRQPLLHPESCLSFSLLLLWSLHLRLYIYHLNSNIHSASPCITLLHVVHIITTSIPVCSSCVMVWYKFSATSLLTYLPHCCFWLCAIACGSFRYPPSIDFSRSIFSFHAILVMFLWSFQYVIRKVLCCAPRLSLVHIIMVLRLAFMEWLLPHNFTACRPFHSACVTFFSSIPQCCLEVYILFASD